MKIIEVCETSWDIRMLYANADTPDSRALLGYMLYTGKTDDLILGGAFSLLKDIEDANGHVYRLRFISPKEKSREIVRTVDAIIDGVYDDFMLPARAVHRAARKVNDIFED